ncbi:PREDICTED: uncharacterized protein LOC105556028 [Vollenhovia emeryi]|uniref:uncharacterized protein LOC105556028 n=1 Tax=Vollenhovia emeryi TaxID=411798 RepID=UPI0005F447AD|nr:PREDICTED: uncharacterized protein LOC105556028 [Vollenhovia emeryi]
MAPTLINGKIIMQGLWIRELGWDQPIPQELSTAWEEHYKSLVRINALQIPRNVVPANNLGQFDIYGFGDASKRAYGACIYAVSRDKRGIAHSHLICAKARVAPLKTVSIPRLELEAALLLSRLWAVAKKAYGEQIRNTRLWSDSTVVLGWIKTPPNKLNTFVANRASKIQDITKNISWYHVPTNENPADLLSRGVSTEVLAESELWWHGPHWLTDGSKWPLNMKKPEEELPELKTTTVALKASETSSVLTRFSTYRKLKWKRHVLETRMKGPLTVDELGEAEEIIARMVQQETFLQDYEDLIKDRILSSKSKLRALDPFMDKKGLIRVGGRLRHSSLSMEGRHPIILSARHYITSSIMREEHSRLHHCPPEQLLSVVRSRYWPLSGRREARKIVKNCLICFRLRPTTPEIKMGDLPGVRVIGYQRVFTNTGVDYAGPLQVRESRRRGRVHISKGYIALFTCLATRAVHLELVSDLSTAAFLAALNRFIARRGICSQMLSDNGTNFVGAARELKEIYEFLEKEGKKMQSALAQRKIAWSFIPPRAPHFGGSWEAVRPKGLFRAYSFPFPDWGLDPPTCAKGLPENRLARRQHIQKLSQQFWERWQAEYLQELQRRNKWADGGDNITMDTLVLLKEDHVPPLQWSLGRVSALFPGQDGVVRVVSVRTRSGEVKRSVKKLCPIPVSSSKSDGGFTQQQFNVLTVKWMAKKYLPFSFFDDDFTVGYFKLINPNLKVPNRNTLRKLAEQLFEQTQSKIKEIF